MTMGTPPSRGRFTVPDRSYPKGRGRSERMRSRIRSIPGRAGRGAGKAISRGRSAVPVPIKGRAAALALVGVLGGSVVSCGAEEPASGSPDPCRLVTSADARSLLGEPLTVGPRRERSGDSAACVFLRGAGPGVGVVKLAVVERTVSVAEFTRLAAAVPDDSELERVEVEGARAAFWETTRSASDSGTLSVLSRSNPLVLQVAIPGERPGRVLRMARSLMARVLERS